jgi:hypothetical protein
MSLLFLSIQLGGSLKIFPCLDRIVKSRARFSDLMRLRYDILWYLLEI